MITQQSLPEWLRCSRHYMALCIDSDSWQWAPFVSEDNTSMAGQIPDWEQGRDSNLLDSDCKTVPSIPFISTPMRVHFVGKLEVSNNDFIKLLRRMNTTMYRNVLPQYLAIEITQHQWLFMCSCITLSFPSGFSLKIPLPSYLICNELLYLEYKSLLDRAQIFYLLSLFLLPPIPLPNQ